MKVYGIIQKNGRHLDISENLLAAKQYAAKHGIAEVSVRYTRSNAVCVEEIKDGKRN
jgi:hypothetical protein